MMDTIERTIAAYEATADEYAERVKNIYLHNDIKFFLQAMLPGSLILDIGCGSGRDAKIFTGQSYRVIGIDLSDKMLSYAQQHVPNADFMKMDMRLLGFGSVRFQGIWANAAYLHLPKKELVSALQAAQRVLNPGGRFFASFKQGKGEGFEADKRYTGIEKYYSYYNPSEVQDAMVNAGFSIVDMNTAAYENKYNKGTGWVNVHCTKRITGPVPVAQEELSLP